MRPLENDGRILDSRGHTHTKKQQIQMMDIGNK
jgi:hypothetical protein